MTKFKVGDRVRVVRFNRPTGVKIPHDYIGREFFIKADGGDYDGEPSWHNPEAHNPSLPYRWKESELELVAPSGPVRTVTRKEIVKGNYDGVFVGHEVEGAVMVAIQGRYHDAADLRAAAEVFTQLADALDDQK